MTGSAKIDLYRRNPAENGQEKRTCRQDRYLARKYIFYMYIHLWNNEISHYNITTWNITAQSIISIQHLKTEQAKNIFAIYHSFVKLYTKHNHSIVTQISI